VAIIGVDDSPVVNMTLPPLTSIRFDLAQEAATVSTRLADALGLEHADHGVAHIPVTVSGAEPPGIWSELLSETT
jgi:hypothetical protein